MKIFVILYNDNTQDGMLNNLQGVFSTHELAKAYLKKERLLTDKSMSIIELELDNPQSSTWDYI